MNSGPSASVALRACRGPLGVVSHPGTLNPGTRYR